MPHEHFYVLAAEELHTGNAIKALQVKAYAEADGDEKKAAAWYIRHRAEELEVLTMAAAATEVAKREAAIRQQQARKAELHEKCSTMLTRLDESRWRTAREEMLLWGEHNDWPRIAVDGTDQVLPGRKQWRRFLEEQENLRVEQVLWIILNRKFDNWKPAQ